MDIGLLWWLSGKEPPCQCRRHRRLKFSRVQGHTQRLLSGDVQRNPACLDRVTRRSLMYISCLRVFTRQNGYPYIPAVHSPSHLSQQLYQRSYSPWGSKVQACSQTIRVTISSPREPALCSHQDPVSLLLPQPHSSMEPVSACVGCHNSVYRLSKRFKPWPFVFPQFRRLEVQDQGIGRFSSFCGLSPWPAEGHFSLCSHMVFLLGSYVTGVFMCLHVSFL